MTADAPLSFDRAADYYDRTRALPQEAMAVVVDLVANELRSRGRVLEIGVGTGRMALPLRAAGVDMAGIDISRPMLLKLVEKAGDGASLGIAIADAVRLPFETDSFGAALACHVLHLIPRWEQAVEELLRVVAPGGVILVDPGGLVEGEVGAIQRRFKEVIHGARPGMQGDEDLDELMSTLGAMPRALPVVRATDRISYERLIGELEGGLYSMTWNSEASELATAATIVRGWARESFGDLGAERTYGWDIRWRAYDLPP